MIIAIFVVLNRRVMEKRVIKSLIIEKQNEIPTMEIMPRELELEETCNYVFVGLRRAGKSYLMFQHIQELLLKKEVRIEEILYINFEDERIADIKVEELGLIVEAYHDYILINHGFIWMKYRMYKDGKSLYVVWLIPNIEFLLREVMHKC